MSGETHTHTHTYVIETVRKELLEKKIPVIQEAKGSDAVTN